MRPFRSTSRRCARPAFVACEACARLAVTGAVTARRAVGLAGPGARHPVRHARRHRDHVREDRGGQPSEASQRVQHDSCMCVGPRGPSPTRRARPRPGDQGARPRRCGQKHAAADIGCAQAHPPRHAPCLAPQTAPTTTRRGFTTRFTCAAFSAAERRRRVAARTLARLPPCAPAAPSLARSCMPSPPARGPPVASARDQPILLAQDAQPGADIPPPRA